MKIFLFHYYLYLNWEVEVGGYLYHVVCDNKDKAPKRQTLQFNTPQTEKHIPRTLIRGVGGGW